MRAPDLREALRLHSMWLRREPGGERLEVHDADLRGASLRGADMRGAHIYSADLSGADMSRARLGRARLVGVRLEGAALSYVSAQSIVLRGCDLRAANVSHADMRGADLSGACMSDVHGACAILSSARLRGADLSGANLRGARLYRADMRCARLRGATLPTPPMLLLAEWGALSDGLTALALAYEASCHPDPDAFSRWSEEGDRPPHAGDARVPRACHCIGRPECWDSDLAAPRPYDLMVALVRECCADSDFHDEVAP